jgi:hypothetical protein
VQALKRAPLFEGLSRKELVLLARVTEDLEVPAGEVLCREGETGQEFFVITPAAPLDDREQRGEHPGAGRCAVASRQKQAPAPRRPRS